MLKADDRAEDAARQHMQQQHPAYPVNALIEIALIGNALHQLKIREVPNAPQSRCRAEEVKREERAGGENAADSSHERCGHTARLCEENGDHGEDMRQNGAVKPKRSSPGRRNMVDFLMVRRD